MRSTLCVLFLLVGVVRSAADEKSDRERRVRVALALAATGDKVEANAECGKCREDVAAARVDAVRDRKPLVLFVGGPCDGLGKAAEAAGAIPAKVNEYVGDDRPKGEQRIVVLEPRPDGAGLMIAATLPAKSDPEKVASEVKKATPKVESRKLDWMN